MSKGGTLSERVTRLETHDEIDHKRIAKIEEQVADIHDLIMQGKGFRAAVVLLAAALSGGAAALGAYLSKGKFW